MLAARRNDELFGLLELAPYRSWSLRRYGVEALLAEGKPEEAIAYAEACRGGNRPDWAIDAKCEEILLAQGRHEEAYTKYALTANAADTPAESFTLIKEKYPRIERRRILIDLARNTGDPGRLFAPAKDEGLLDVALRFAQLGSTDPRTLSRAAEELAERDPRFSVAVGLLAMERFLDSPETRVLPSEVTAAWDHTAAAAQRLGALEQVRAAALMRKSRRSGFLENVLQRHILRTDGSMTPN